MREIVILGSTGSIGIQALEIVASHPTKFKVIGLSAGSNNLELLIEQAKRFRVPIIGTTGDKSKISGAGIEIVDGANSASIIAAITCDVVLNAISGSIGLAPTLAALAAGNKVALANKESLVAGGDLVMSFGREKIIPVDSEHSAIFQCLLSGKLADVRKLILTASGGPFRERRDLNTVTVKEALNHPTWEMGKVVTINSATLVNKGLEIIEARYLFDLPYSKIETVIHPQSVVHSMVEFKDGSTLAQASPPNMKGPIAYALAYPDRVSEAIESVNWQAKQNWTFEPIDAERFPAIELARRCGELGGGTTAIFNAANEIAVDAFLAGKLAFPEIVETVEKVVQKLGASAPIKLRDLKDVSAIEKDARVLATELTGV